MAFTRINWLIIGGLLLIVATLGINPNLALPVAIILRIISIVIPIALIVPKQISEVKRPQNEFTFLRWRLLIGVSSYVLLSLFPLTYNILRFTGTDLEWLRDLATVTGNLANLALIMLVASLYNPGKKIRFNNEGPSQGGNYENNQAGNTKQQLR